jgi:Dolichyl-phosphate-mannose-protein mannosyltransferase
MGQAVATAPSSPKRAAISWAWIGPRTSAWAVGLGIMVAAVGLRLPHIGVIPRFTDETDEVMWSLAIVRGEILPLTNILTYIGAGYNYLLAAVLALFGPHPTLPRYFVMTTGVLTVGTTFLLGRELTAPRRRGDRCQERTNSHLRPGPTSPSADAIAVGLLAAALLAVSPVHILVNSRIAWAASITPLFTTLGLWLLARAVRRGEGRSFAAAGLVLGLALQSHPTVIGLLPGAAAWVLLRARALLVSGWGMLAIFLFVLGCSNLIAYNLLTGFGSIAEGLAKTDGYVALQEDTPEDYPTSLLLALQGLARTLAGGIGDHRDARVPLLQPSILVWIALVPSAVLFAARRGIWLPALVLPPYLLLLPGLVAKFDPLFNGRYMMPLVPLIGTAVALLIVAAWRRATGRAASARAVLAGLIVLLVADPILSLRSYERAALAEGGNAPYVELADRIRRERQPDERVLLDSDLGGVRSSSARDGMGTLEYLLAVRPDPVPVTSGRVDDISAWVRAEPDGYLLVLLPYARQKLETRYRLTLVGRAPSPPDHRLDRVRLYRVREVRR